MCVLRLNPRRATPEKQDSRPQRLASHLHLSLALPLRQLAFLPGSLFVSDAAASATAVGRAPVCCTAVGGFAIARARTRVSVLQQRRRCLGTLPAFRSTSTTLNSIRFHAPLLAIHCQRFLPSIHSAFLILR